ncbi:response regulator [Fibrella forsythiae]|uniref:Response regulator n=1 Tax=Fibrella forsythiae TaxID=2817061 RepID=A0ABS3JI89_9BACT|nr:response regulator [Fibrella forsythiae]MBO0949732.1 response regulator [Fibrella forsythiae]
MKSDTTLSAIRTQNFRQARILLIESDPDQLSIIAHCLKECLPEVELIKATNEREAITYLKDCKLEEWKLPKMILLDASIPNRENGLRILQHIKELPAPANQIPVVVLSHSAHSDDISEAYDRGSSSYLVKPTSDDEWISYFQMLRRYWWETVSLPPTDYRY